MDKVPRIKGFSQLLDSVADLSGMDRREVRGMALSEVRNSNMRNFGPIESLAEDPEFNQILGHLAQASGVSKRKMKRMMVRDMVAQNLTVKYHLSADEEISSAYSSTSRANGTQRHYE